MNRGFTLIEVLVVLFVLTVFSGVMFVMFEVPTYNHISPVACQLKAFSNRERCYFKENVWFNKHGNINKANTVHIGSITCVFQLGFGRFRCE